jgi:hypothetical protein
MCTSLALIGCDQAADIAKESFKTGKTIREVAREQTHAVPISMNVRPKRMTQPQADSRWRRRVTSTGPYFSSTPVTVLSSSLHLPFAGGHVHHFARGISWFATFCRWTWLALAGNSTTLHS